MVKQGQKEKPKKLKLTLQSLWKYFSEVKISFVLVFILVVIQTIVTLSSPYIIGRIIDILALGPINNELTPLSFLVLFLLATYVLDGFLNWLQGFMMASTSQKIVKHLRMELFEKITKLPIVFFDQRQHGDIMSRFTNDIDNVSTTISSSTVQLMSSLFTIGGSLILMLIISPELTLVALTVVPIIYLLTYVISKQTRSMFKKQQVSLGSLNGLIEESIEGLHIVKAFNQEAQLLERFKAHSQSLFVSGKSAQIYTGLLMPMMNVIGNLSFAFIAFWGGYLVFNHSISIGIVVSFMTYSRQFIRPLNDLASIFNTLMSAIAGAERIFEVIDEKEEEPSHMGCLINQNAPSHVRFDDVSFEYIPNQKILKNISFSVEPGKKIALVGPTGSGKTTIVNLLARFYDVTGGSIYIDDIKLEDYDRNSLRNAFGIVLQETYLFSGTIMENLLYGNLNASEGEIMEATKLAGAYDFIVKLTEQFETQLIDGGMNISQGERQLLTIARAILAKPKILILDEATSNVDTRTEKRIQKALLGLMENRTSFIIAHRLSTIRDADMILVIDNGEIIEHGNHESLINQKGYYYQMLHRMEKNKDMDQTTKFMEEK